MKKVSCAVHNCKCIALPKEDLCRLHFLKRAYKAIKKEGGFEDADSEDYQLD